MPAPQPIPPISLIGIQGRNGSDSTLMIPEKMCLEARNIDWFRSSLGRRRGGATAISISGGTAHANGVLSMARHVPADNQGAAEFWTLDGSLNFHRMAASVSFANPSVVDACTASPQETNWQSFGGNLYVAYKSAVNRLHVWDGTSLRRVGIAASTSAPSTGAPSGGAVTATRKYRVAFTKQVSGITTTRSNLSAASGSVALVAQQVVITRMSAPGEGETHWELYAAQDASFADYRLLGTTAIGTATFTDNTATIPTTVAPAEGANTPPPSAKYMVADDSRIIMAGAHETVAGDAMAPSAFRIWWTAAKNSSDGGDSERISNTGTINGYADVEEAVTGLSQPMQLVNAAANSLERGSFYVFSAASQWKFVSTGEADAPYLKFRITGGAGCIHHKSIIVAVDANGQPSIYWASASGIMRIGVDGQQFMGEDCVDVWETINLDATIPCHSVYHPDKKQVWFWIAINGSSYPNYRIVFDTRLGKVTDQGVRFGWSTADGESAKAYCSCMFSETIAASMGRKLKPYIGYSGGTAIWRCDTADMTDNGTAFQAYMDSKSYAPWGLFGLGGWVEPPLLVAQVSDGASVRLTVYRDEGAESGTSDAELSDFSDSGDAVYVFPTFDAKLADSHTFRCRIGDAQATAATWNLSALICQVQAQ